MTKISKLFESISPLQFSKAGFQDIPSIGDGYWWRSVNHAWLTFVVEFDEDLHVELLSPYPISSAGPTTFAEYCEEIDTWSSWLGMDQEEEMENFLLRTGLAPGQKFLTELKFSSHMDYWGEYDEELDWRVLDVEPWPKEKVLEGWEEYFKCHAVAFPALTQTALSFP